MNADELLRDALGALVLLAIAAFFSCSETALFSLQPLDRQALRGRAKRTVEALLSRPRRTLASILLGNELVNIALPAVTGGLLLKFGPRIAWINLIAVPLLLVTLGDVLPKTIALRFNRRIAPILAPPIRVFSFCVTPIRGVLTFVAEAVLGATGASNVRGQSQLREEHLRAIIDQGRASGTLAEMEQEVIDKVFEFGNLTVGRVMTPRPDMFAQSIEVPWPRLLSVLKEAGYSRVPIWEGSTDNIIGLLMVKDLLPLLIASSQNPGSGPSARQIRKLLRSPRFVPTTRRADDMLSEFRREKFHFALVVDEHGSVVGLVTLDDLLGELVGELLDETDVEVHQVTPQEDGAFLVKAYMDVEDFADRFGLEVPEGEYNTMGGFVISQLGDLAKEGDEVHWNGLRIVVQRVDGRRVTDLRVERRTEETEGPTEPVESPATPPTEELAP